MGSWIKKSGGGGDTEWVKIVLEEGETFEGRYAGPRDQNGSNGPFVSHEFEKEDDEAVYQISGASLNRGLADVEPGTTVRLTFDGIVTTKSKRTCKAYTVEVYADLPAPAGRKTSI